MVYSENARVSITKHIKSQWDTKYKEYYTNKRDEWRKENKTEYNELMRKYMQKRNLYLNECKAFRQILLN